MNLNYYTIRPYLALYLHTFKLTFHVFVLPAMRNVGGLHADCWMQARPLPHLVLKIQIIAIFAKSDFRASKKSSWKDKCNCSSGLKNYLKTNKNWLWSLGSVYHQERHWREFHDLVHILSGTETNHTQNQSQMHTHCATTIFQLLGMTPKGRKIMKRLFRLWGTVRCRFTCFSVRFSQHKPKMQC